MSKKVKDLPDYRRKVILKRIMRALYRKKDNDGKADN
jgi:hypothetical protein